MKPGNYTAQQFFQHAKVAGGIEIRGYVAYDPQKPNKVLFGVDPCVFPAEEMDEANILSVDVGCPHFFPKDPTKKAWEATLHIDDTKIPAWIATLWKLTASCNSSSSHSPGQWTGCCPSSYRYGSAYRYRPSCC